MISMGSVSSSIQNLTQKKPQKQKTFHDKSILHGSAVLNYLKLIFQIHNIPDDVLTYLRENYLKKMFFLDLKWDLDTCNQLVRVEEDGITLHFGGTGSWEHSVLGLPANIPTFSIYIVKSDSMAIGYAPREGFDIGACTMYTKGMYLYTGNTLYYGGVKCKKREGPIVAHHGDFYYQPNTLITAYLDLEKKILGFKHNDEDYGTCYSEIQTSEDLFPAVTCVGVATIVLIRGHIDYKEAKKLYGIKSGLEVI